MLFQLPSIVPRRISVITSGGKISQLLASSSLRCYAYASTKRGLSTTPLVTSSLLQRVHHHHHHVDDGHGGPKSTMSWNNHHSQNNNHHYYCSHSRMKNYYYQQNLFFGTSHHNNHLLLVNHHPRYFSSKYISVDHSAAYQDAMSSPHGSQLQLALEEGRGKDDAPFDPFSQFLDAMGSTENGMDDENYDDDDDGDDDIEEAEYEPIEDYGTNSNRNNDSNGGQINDDDDIDESVDGTSSSLSPRPHPTYTTTGALYRPKSERLALRAGYPAGGDFAVISLAGLQHKVTVDDLLVVNKLKPVSAWSVGSTHTIKDENILLLANQDKTLVGLPGVKGGEVDVMVEEITRDKTLIIFKKRRRKNSRRKNGFRRQVTFLRVLDVRMPGMGKRETQGGEDRAIVEEQAVNLAA